MNRKGIIAILVALILVLGGVIAYFSGVFSKDTVESVPEGSQSVGNVIEYDGKKYAYNTHLTNILFLGIDTNDTLDKFSKPAHAGQSDAIYLLTLNNETGEVSIIQINRNAMTDIDIYDKSGQVSETIPGQVTLQYAYGNGGTQSCWAAKQTICEMLYDIPVDGYLVMNMEGISTINDEFGGVTITMPRDYTVIDPSMTEGAQVHIMGDVAERFVRYRDLTQFNSVADRMDRQVLYITALMDTMRNRGGNEVYNTISPYLNDLILTNLGPEDFNTMAQFSYDNCRIYQTPGKMVDTENFEEFYINDEEFHKYIVENYYMSMP